MFVPKNWLSEGTDSLAKRFPAAAVDLENSPQNVVHLLMQTKNGLEKLKSNQDSADKETERLDARIEGLSTRLTELVSRVDSLPTEERVAERLRSEIGEAIQDALEDCRMLDDSVFSLLSAEIIDMGYMQAMPGFYKEPPGSSNGFCFDLLTGGLPDFPDWEPSFNFGGGPVNARDGLSVSQGLAADNITADIIAANTVIADSVATQLLNAREGSIDALAAACGKIGELEACTATISACSVSYAGITELEAVSATISGCLSLGAIGDVEGCIDELRAGMDSIVKVPAPPDNVNDYALQCIGGVLTWVPL